jgi:hypothetical protein
MTRQRAYTIAQVCEILTLPRRTFFKLRGAGKLPMLEELRPRLGRVVRYRADLVDRYADGQWGQPRSFASHRRAS